MKKLRTIHNFNIQRYSFVLCYFVYFSFYVNAHMCTLFCVYVHAHLLTVIQNLSTRVCCMPGTTAGTQKTIMEASVSVEFSYSWEEVFSKQENK